MIILTCVEQYVLFNVQLVELRVYVMCSVSRCHCVTECV